MKKDSLFILPFDHRSSFLAKIFNIKNRKPSDEEIKKVKEFKEVIYMGFKWAVEEDGIPKSSAAILIDEEFGEEIIKDAIASGYTTCISTEKSWQKEFEFEYGDDFIDHLDRYKPSFAKALVKYNPDGDQDLNSRQRKKLKILSDLCKERDYGFLLESLVIATEEQMIQVQRDKKRYDNELRPKLMVKMINEIRKDGISPDIWKIEGLEDPEDYRLLIDAIGTDAKAIVLGRGADDAQVEKWLTAGANVNGIIGFAIGRTIFWQSLMDYKEGKIDRDIAIKRIGEKYKRFYDFFIKTSNKTRGKRESLNQQK